MTIDAGINSWQKPNSYLSAWRVHDWSRRGWRSTRNFLIDSGRKHKHWVSCEFPTQIRFTLSKLRLTYLNRGGSIGSFCISTIRMTLCFAPELNASPCCEGVYLKKRKKKNSNILWTCQQHLAMQRQLNLFLPYNERFRQLCKQVMRK